MFRYVLTGVAVALASFVPAAPAGASDQICVVVDMNRPFELSPIPGECRLITWTAGVNCIPSTVTNNVVDVLIVVCYPAPLQP